MSEFSEKVNDLVGKMTQGDDGKWSLPEDVKADLDEPTLHAVTAERRYRDTQASYTKSRQELKKEQAISQGLQDRILASDIVLTKEQRAELTQLKTSDPEAWRNKLNEYETQGKEQLSTELEEIKQNSANKSALEVRQEQMAAWSASTGIELTDDIVANELPPRMTKALENGEVTFEEFLDQAGEFLKADKIIKGSDESTEDDTKDLTRIPGGKEPTNKAQEMDLDETYENTMF